MTGNAAMAAPPAPGVARKNSLTILLCALAVVVEGFELQAFGVAAAELRAALGLSAQSIGLLASASIVGLICGSLVGGRLADRVGRKHVLIPSIALFAGFMLLTATASNFEMLFALRFLTGVGLGGAMPNLVAIAAEAGPAEGRLWRVTAMMSGFPAGGLLAGLFGVGPWATQWQAIFLFGGLIPLALLPLLMFGLPDTHRERLKTGQPTDQSVATLRHALFAERRAGTTLLLWATFFCTQIIVYLMTNWLPSLMRADGFERWQAAAAISAFNIGGATASITIGWFMTRGRRWIVPLVNYGGMSVMLLVLSLPNMSFPVMFLCSLVTGGFVIGSTLLLYALAADVYATRFRGTGVGAATAFGRVGSTIGPVLGGALIGLGATSATVLPALIPLAIIAGITTTLVARKPPVL